MPTITSRLCLLIAEQILGCFLLVIIPFQAPRAQQPTEVSGIVRDQAGSPVSGAIVAALRGARIVASSATDSNGAFSISTPEGSIDSIVVSRTGFAKLTAKALGPVMQVTLLAIAEIAPVLISDVRRERPRRRALPPEIGAQERRTTLQSNVSGDNSGHYASVLATSAGYSIVVDGAGNVVGLSTLDLSRQQNSVTLDGIRYDPQELPRDAPVLIRATTSPYNATRGGFSGASIAITTPSSLLAPQSSFRVSLESKELQGPKQAFFSQARGFSEVRVSGTKTRVLAPNRSALSFSVQTSARQRSLGSIFLENAFRLESNGLNPHAIDSVINSSRARGVDLLGEQASAVRASYSGSLLMRLDDAPSNRRQLASTLSFRCRKANSDFSSFLVSPSGAGTSRACAVGSSSTLSRYVHDVVLNETRLGFSASRESRQSKDKRTTSVIAIGGPRSADQGLQVSVGGNALLPYRSTTKSAELTNTSTWHSLSARHRAEFQMTLRYDYVKELSLQDQYGTVTFPNATAFATLHPLTFHQLLARRKDGDEAISGSIAFSDEWDLTDDFAFTYGARSDIQTLLSSASIASAGKAPLAATLDPRVGFIWGYGTATKGMGPFGVERKSSLRGGIGRFTNLYSAGILQPLTGDTPRRELFCNEAVLAGSTYGTDGNFLPAEACLASGSGEPSVERIAESYRPEISTRVTLGWTSRVVGLARSSIELVSSRTTKLPSAISDNQLPSPAFALAGEQNRPVFAPLASIDPTFANFDYLAGRRDAAFSRVVTHVSDGVSRAKQLTLNVSNDQRGEGPRVAVSYTFRSISTFQRGFEGSTAANPNVRTWERSVLSPRHQVALLGSIPLGRFTAEVFLRASRQRSFTPMVRRDINGDGVSNDRAFVFSQSASEDEGIQMRELIEHLPTRLARCLDRQAGTIAQTASCELPTQYETNVAIRVEPVGSRRLSAVFTLTNVLTLLDVILHGSGHTRGWGDRGLVDPYLLTPSGFDPTQKRFHYEVNQNFGSRTSLLSSPIGQFRSAIEVKFLTGSSNDRRIAEQNRLATRRESTSSDELAGRIRKTIPNGIPILLSGASEIELTPAQVDALTRLQSSFTTTVDSIWSASIDYSSQPASSYNPQLHIRIVKLATDHAYEAAAALAVAIRKVLTNDQVKLLPNAVAQLLDPVWLKNSRPKP